MVKQGLTWQGSYIIFPKELKVPEVNTGKEEIVPPCPNDMAPTSAPVEGVEIGVAPGRK